MEVQIAKSDVSEVGPADLLLHSLKTLREFKEQAGKLCPEGGREALADCSSL